MKSKLFESLYHKLLEDPHIDVRISAELDIWTNGDSADDERVREFFGAFVFEYGMFHNLLESSGAQGDSHDLQLFLEDDKIVMKGTTNIFSGYGEDSYDEEEDDDEGVEDVDEETDEAEEDGISFEWVFDLEGNVL